MNVCEFCNAYIANFEVHSCKKYGNQHSQSSATLPRSISDIRTQDIESGSAQQTDYEAQRPFLCESNSSTQQSFLPNMHQRIDCEETAADETFSQRAVTNQNIYNPETSYFLFPDWPHDQERQSGSTHLQYPSGANYLITKQNPQCSVASNPEQSANASMPVAEPYFLPGFQQTFGQRHARTNQMAHPPNASFQMESSGISRTHKMSEQFISDFNEIFDASANRISPQYKTPSGIAILTVPNAQYYAMDPIPQTDSTGTIHSNKCAKEFQPKDHPEPHDRSHSRARPYACKYCDKAFLSSSDLTNHIHTHTGEKPYKCAVCNRCYADRSNLRRHTSIHTGGSLKCRECGERFSQSSTLHEHVRVIHSGENPNKCTKCGKYFANTSSLRTHILSIHTAETPNKCSECGKCFAYPSVLSRHIRSIHTAEKPYKCTECGQCFSRRDNLRDHVRTMHTGG
ncbi:hypothetical protein CDAR_193311 [Caerostris darwini]|uniref:C2H2-type domain-containing protein n=1 Tax=Caerostris darwini TaxID=1538125 RepID=A0AAV4QZI9_9ARAC|nr:hypothetical protein CDAR_193311 [Caerostris darwini]